MSLGGSAPEHRISDSAHPHITHKLPSRIHTRASTPHIHVCIARNFMYARNYQCTHPSAYPNPCIHPLTRNYQCTYTSTRAQLSMYIPPSTHTYTIYTHHLTHTHKNVHARIHALTAASIYPSCCSLTPTLIHTHTHH